MPKTVFRFVIVLLPLLVMAFGLHLFILNMRDLPLFGNKIVLSYSINAVLAIAIIMALFKLKERYKDQIGFLYLFGSGLKFLVFFIVFYPSYHSDGVMSKLEFAAFFVPYVICLVLETIFLAKMLNKMS